MELNLAEQTNKRVLKGWYMYDWANSAFAVTILAALFGPYLDQAVVPEGGVDIAWLGMKSVTATSLYGYAVGISAFFVLISSPILGAIADYTAAKKKFLMLFCYLGSFSTMLMIAIGPGDVLLALILFFVANFSFVSANVFYDAFLPHIAPPKDQDEVSGKGYAYGYAGGGILFVIHLILVQFHESLGIPDAGLAVRIALSSVGLWWGGFALITFSRLSEPQVSSVKSSVLGLVKVGFRRTILLVQKIRMTRQFLLFLIAFMIYNDGIQTVIVMATVYGSEELQFDTLTLMGCLLMVQAVGIIGARFFAWLASRLSTKTAILISLFVWALVVIYAFFMTEAIEFWILGAIVGLVLGGSQALSRSYYSKMIPPSASAEMFGFFSVFEKFSAIWGPLMFAVIRQLSGSSRWSILSLIAFFIIGFVLLAFVNTKKVDEEKTKLEAILAEAN
jgi:MFS transporter, UMF1 family